MKHKLWRRIKALLFPPRCASCGTLLDGDASAGLCPICHANFLHTENFGCPLCNRPDLDCRCLPRYSSRYVRAYLHTCAYLPGVMRVLDLDETAGLVAPRPVCLVTPQYARRNWAARLYQRLGVPQRYSQAGSLSQAIRAVLNEAPGA